MLTISKPLSAAQAEDYYLREYTSAGENYGGEEGVAGRWHGRLADEYGLRGEVNKEQYARLCAGRHPETGEQLVRHVESRTLVNRYGREIRTRGHRAGWDATFSAPKTVSLAAVAGGDGRVRRAHAESVGVALDELERYTQARMGGNRPAETTGRMVAAKFEHDAARPDRLTAYAAPQLHTHVVIFNITRTEQGITKPVQPFELYRSQQYATAVYRINLAERLRRIGYEVEVDARTGAPEIRGFDPEYVRESSPRSAEVRRGAKEIRARLESAGASVKEGAGLRQAAARSDRGGKEYDRREIRGRALAMDARYGHQAEKAYRAALGRGPLLHTAEEMMTRAREAVTYARESAAGRGVAVDRRSLMADAFRHDLGLTSYEAVLEEFTSREASGEFAGLIKERGRRVSVEHSANVEERSAGNSRKVVEQLSAGDLKDALDRLRDEGRVIEIRGERAMLRAVAADYCARSEGTLIIASMKEQREALNELIRQRLRAEGGISSEEHAVKIYLERQEMKGQKRAAAGSYHPGGDVIRFNRGSKVYGVEAGEYARVLAADVRENTLTVERADGRELTFNPARLSGVSVYGEGERVFAAGERVRFTAPFKKHRIAGGELGRVTGVDGGRFSITLDSKRSVSFTAEEYRHLDYGYAVTDYSSRAGQAFDRMLVCVDTRLPDAALGRQMRQAALAGTGEGVRVYADDAGQLGEAVGRGAGKQHAAEVGGTGGVAGRDTSAVDLNRAAVSTGAEGVGAAAEVVEGMELGLVL